MSNCGTENEKPVFGLSGLNFINMLPKALRIASVSKQKKRGNMLRAVTEYMVTHLHVFLFQAEVHRHFHRFREVQQCTLLSIKTGGCSEDCSYCPQSSRYR
jgi:biotin synthase-like enzyme